MTHHFALRTFRLTAASLLLAMLGACSSWLPTPSSPPRFYAFEQAKTALPPAPASAAATTLIINPPHAAPGFDSRRIIYVREPYLLEYYAHSEWVDTPARMLAPLMVGAIENTSAFRAVILTPSPAVGELRLYSEIVRLQHEVGNLPGRVRFTLRAYLVDNATRQVVASREFEQTVTAESETPYAGVIAANLAVRGVLVELANFCQEIGKNRRLTAALGKAPLGAAEQ